MTDEYLQLKDDVSIAERLVVGDELDRIIDEKLKREPTKPSPLYEGRLDHLKSEIQELQDDLAHAQDDIFLLKFGVGALVIFYIVYLVLFYIV